MPSIRRSLLAAAALLAAGFLPAPARAGTPLDATTRDFDQTHLVVRVVPHVAEGTVDGRTTVRFTSLADPLKVLRLHCVETTVLSCADGRGTPLEFALGDGVLSVTLAQPLPRSQAGEVTVVHRSKPRAGLYFHAPTKESPDTPLEMYSQGEGDDNRRWFPCYDEPDDRSTCEVYATVANDLKTVSNGTLVESKPAGEGLREDHWKLDQRVPSYLVSLVVGRFDTVVHRWRDVPLEYNGPVGRGEEACLGCGDTPKMMEFFVDYTGRAYPYPRYAQTTVWDFVYGGMENASATTMNMRLLHGADVDPVYSADGLVAHELAHQWFGDLLTCRTFDHIWLNEGFATYFTDLFFERRDGAERFALERFRQNRGYMEGTPHPESLSLKPTPRGDLPVEMDGGKQYDRGAAVLHQLRIELGDDVFRRGIRRYVKDNDDRAVVTEDLRHAMEAEAGTSLEWFFDQWVYGGGYPVLRFTTTESSSPDEKRVLHLTVEQTQATGSGLADVYRITVPCRVGSTDVRLDLRRRSQSFDFDHLEPGARVRPDVGGGAFARIEVAGRDFADCVMALSKDPDVVTRMRAAEALVEWPDAAYGVLMTYGKGDRSYAVRQQCAKSLAALPGPGATAGLVLLAADADARVREAVAEGLGGRSREEPSVASTLLGLADKDPNPYVRAMAARGLGKIHADGAFETLSRLLSVDSHRETVRAGALDGLAALGDRRAIDLAKPLLPYAWRRGDHHGMRKAALELLAALAPDEPETHAEIVKLLDDGYHRMREWAAEWAGKLKVRSATKALEKMAADDPHGGPKRAAKEALERIKAK
jgi:aminopeptidase N